MKAKSLATASIITDPRTDRVLTWLKVPEKRARIPGIEGLLPTLEDGITVAFTAVNDAVLA
jgi:hypothetical protein